MNLISIFYKKIKLFTYQLHRKAIFIPDKQYKTINVSDYLQNDENNIYSIGVYFSGTIKHLYQIKQWFKILSLLNSKQKIIFIVRKKSVFNWISKNTIFPVVFCHNINDLISTYEESNLKVILYVNHGLQNFQSLMCRKVIHIHINHGESEKLSTISNQANSYHYVFIVGDAAYDKYNLNLLKKDMSKFIKVGRPQLDFIEYMDIPNIDKNKIIILYAPTWEGTHDAMNFTSIDKYGIDIIKQIINNPKYHLIYKPHPNIGFRDLKIQKMNNKIIKILTKRNNATIIDNIDINSIFKHVDLAIFDNSSVAIDYLHTDKPMMLTDTFQNLKDVKHNISITKAGKILTTYDINSLYIIINKEIKNDSYKNIRNKIKEYYLGKFDYNKKESTNIFIKTILNILQNLGR